MELWKQAMELGSSAAHSQFGAHYDKGGDLKKAKFHYEAAAMAGHEVARYNLRNMEFHAGNVPRAVKHLRIAASAGFYCAMHTVRLIFEEGALSRDTFDSTLAAYNNSCAEMKSEARDSIIKTILEDE